jgi:hypothetical protein
MAAGPRDRQGRVADNLQRWHCPGGTLAHWSAGQPWGFADSPLEDILQHLVGRSSPGYMPGHHLAAALPRQHLLQLRTHTLDLRRLASSDLLEPDLEAEVEARPEETESHSCRSSGPLAGVDFAEDIVATCWAEVLVRLRTV